MRNIPKYDEFVSETKLRVERIKVVFKGKLPPRLVAHAERWDLEYGDNWILFTGKPGELRNTEPNVLDGIPKQDYRMIELDDDDNEVNESYGGKLNDVSDDIITAAISIGLKPHLFVHTIHGDGVHVEFGANVKLETIERLSKELGKMGRDVKATRSGERSELVVNESSINESLTSFPSKIKILRDVQLWKSANVQPRIVYASTKPGKEYRSDGIVWRAGSVPFAQSTADQSGGVSYKVSRFQKHQGYVKLQDLDALISSGDILPYSGDQELDDYIRDKGLESASRKFAHTKGDRVYIRWRAEQLGKSGSIQESIESGMSDDQIIRWINDLDMPESKTNEVIGHALEYHPRPKDTKELKEIVDDVLKRMGVKQFESLRNLPSYELFEANGPHWIRTSFGIEIDGSKFELRGDKNMGSTDFGKNKFDKKYSYTGPRSNLSELLAKAERICDQWNEAGNGQWFVDAGRFGDLSIYYRKKIGPVWPEEIRE